MFQIISIPFEPLLLVVLPIFQFGATFIFDGNFASMIVGKLLRNRNVGLVPDLPSKADAAAGKIHFAEVYAQGIQRREPPTPKG